MIAMLNYNNSYEITIKTMKKRLYFYIVLEI